MGSRGLAKGLLMHGMGSRGPAKEGATKEAVHGKAIVHGGKSAILTALCVAFGIKARGTQRATSLKDFIKNGCSHALVVVEMSNQGVDAFKFGDYGGKVVIERRITESGNTTVLKDSHG
ncbi:hypothetical protein L7F22_034733, partial [Adiantum nelumboides]|nr:hypothetical protein [Adiantum nelumboides]